MPVTYENRIFLMVFSGCIAQEKGDSLSLIGPAE